MIKSKVATKVGNLLCGGVLSKHKKNRITHILKQQKGNKGHTHHHDDSLDKSLRYVGKHGDFEIGAILGYGKQDDIGGPNGVN